MLKAENTFKREKKTLKINIYISREVVDIIVVLVVVVGVYAVVVEIFVVGLVVVVVTIAVAVF